jgi:DNA polymerase-1
MGADLVPTTGAAVEPQKLPRAPARVGGSPLDHVELKLVESLDDALELKRWAGERREVLAFDTETEGFTHAIHGLRLIQIGDLDTGWAIPWPLWGGLAQELLRDYREPTVAHHRKFDYGFLKYRADIDIPWANGHDTMIECALVDPTRPKGLKPAAARLIDRKATAGETLLHDGMKQHGWTWATVPYNFPPYWIYSALDPVLTAHLHHLLYPHVQASSQKIYEIELAVARICGQMSSTGVLIDRAYISKAIAQLREYTGQVRPWLQEHYGIKSLLSAKQLYAAFLRCGVEVHYTTPTGLPKIDKEVLEGLALMSTTPEARQLAQTITDARHAEKVIGSYLEKFLDLADPNDVVHASINTIQARTGRMSITDPAWQTLHRDDKVVRGAVIPRPGNALITIDASQIEMRLAAAISEDEGLIQAFYDADNGGVDFYSGIASQLFGETVPKSDPRRQAVKTMSYAKLYGASVTTMARSIGLPVEQVKVIHDAFNERFPGLEARSRQTMTNATAMKRRGERPAEWTSYGRYLPADEGHEFALINYRLQAEAADVLKVGTVEVDQGGYGDLMRLLVHDELILEAPVKDAPDVLHGVTQILNDCTHYRVPIPWEGKILTERWKKT